MLNLIIFTGGPLYVMYGQQATHVKTWFSLMFFLICQTRRDPDLLNSQPIRIYLTQLFIPNIVGLIIIIIYFIRSKNLRLGLIRSFKESFL